MLEEQYKYQLRITAVVCHGYHMWSSHPVVGTKRVGCVIFKIQIHNEMHLKYKVRKAEGCRAWILTDFFYTQGGGSKS